MKLNKDVKIQTVGDVPVAVSQQWSGVIRLNSPARLIFAQLRQASLLEE